MIRNRTGYKKVRACNMKKKVYNHNYRGQDSPMNTF
jgi:hypothetical protein